MQSRIHLNPSEIIKLTGQRTEGPQAETEIYSYAVVNEAGEEVGSVEYTDHTSLNGLRRSRYVVQRDRAGNVIVEERW